MRILVTADIHYSLKQFDWLYRVAGDFDLVILAGDHLDIASTVDERVQITVALKTLERLSKRTRVFASSGNHDLDRRNASHEKYAGWINRLRAIGIATDGDTVTMGDCVVSICPWWDGPVGKAQVSEQLERDAKLAKDQWIWVYHAPPEGSPTSQELNRSYGDQELLQWIEELHPDIVLCGHVHNAPFHKAGSWVDKIGSSWVFNAGRQIGDIPAHIIFDTVQKSAVWFSMAGAEIADLENSEEPIRKPLQALPDWLRSEDQDRAPSQV